MSAQVNLNVFFAPNDLNIIVDRPESVGYDRTTEYGGGKLKLLSQGRKLSLDEDTDVKRKAFGRNEAIRLVLDGELVRLRCEAGASKPRPRFRWTSGDNPQEQTPLKDNRTEVVPARTGSHGGNVIGQHCRVHRSSKLQWQSVQLFCFQSNHLEPSRT